MSNDSHYQQGSKGHHTSTSTYADSGQGRNSQDRTEIQGSSLALQAPCNRRHELEYAGESRSKMAKLSSNRFDHASDTATSPHQPFPKGALIRSTTEDKILIVARDDANASSVVGPQIRRAEKCSTLADRLEAAKPVVYRAGGTLPQFPWSTRRAGMILVVDLWSGFGGTLMAALALGAQIIAVSAENNPEVAHVARLSMPNAVRVESVEMISGKDFIPV